MTTCYDSYDLLDAAMKLSRDTTAPIVEMDVVAIIGDAMETIVQANDLDSVISVVVSMCAWIARDHRAEIDAVMAEVARQAAVFQARQAAIFQARQRGTKP